MKYRSKAFRGFIAYMLSVKGSKWQGFPISYGSGLWPSVLFAFLLVLYCFMEKDNFPQGFCCLLKHVLLNEIEMAAI